MMHNAQTEFQWAYPIMEEGPWAMYPSGDGSEEQSNDNSDQHLSKHSDFSVISSATFTTPFCHQDWSTCIEECVGDSPSSPQSPWCDIQLDVPGIVTPNPVEAGVIASTHVEYPIEGMAPVKYRTIDKDKKEAQKVRNRMSAQKHRDRQKQTMLELQAYGQSLQNETVRLRQELQSAHQQIYYLQRRIESLVEGGSKMARLEPGEDASTTVTPVIDPATHESPRPVREISQCSTGEYARAVPRGNAGSRSGIKMRSKWGLGLPLIVGLGCIATLPFVLDDMPKVPTRHLSVSPDNSSQSVVVYVSVTATRSARSSRTLDIQKQETRHPRTPTPHHRVSSPAPRPSLNFLRRSNKKSVLYPRTPAAGLLADEASVGNTTATEDVKFENKRDTLAPDMSNRVVPYPAASSGLRCRCTEESIPEEKLGSSQALITQGYFNQVVCMSPRPLYTGFDTPESLLSDKVVTLRRVSDWKLATQINNTRDAPSLTSNQFELYAIGMCPS